MAAAVFTSDEGGDFDVNCDDIYIHGGFNSWIITGFFLEIPWIDKNNRSESKYITTPRHTMSRIVICSF
jgi:hypothetical protein